MSHTEYARVAAAHGLQQIAGAEPGARGEVVAALAAALRPLSESHRDLNGFVIAYLTQLAALEHLALIERAFSEGVVGEYVCGDWAQVAFELGVGPEPPRPSYTFAPFLGEGEVQMARAGKATERRPTRSKVDKAARKRQRDARKKNRRR